MNAQKYTQNSLAAIEAAKSLTLEHQNQTMEPCHILYALLAQEKGLIPQLIEKLGASASALRMDAESAIDALPSVTGSGREADKFYISQATDTVLATAAGHVGLAGGHLRRAVEVRHGSRRAREESEARPGHRP